MSLKDKFFGISFNIIFLQDKSEKMCIIILLWYYVQFFQFFEMPCILFNQWSNNGVIYGLYSNLRILLINDFASILKLSYLTMIILSTLLSIVLILMIAQLDKLGNFSFRKIDKQTNWICYIFSSYMYTIFLPKSFLHVQFFQYLFQGSSPFYIISNFPFCLFLTIIDILFNSILSNFCLILWQQDISWKQRNDNLRRIIYYQEFKISIGILALQLILGIGNMNNQTLRIIYLLVMILVTGNFAYVYYSYLQLHNSILLMMQISANSIYFLFTSLLLAVEVINLLNGQSFTFNYPIVLICLFLVPFIVQNRNEKEIINLCMKQFKKIDNPYLIIRKCISILNLKKEEKTQILSKQRQTKLILKGIIQTHVAICNKPECPCQNPNSLFDFKMQKLNQNGFESKLFIKYLVSQYFSLGKIKFPNCAYLIIFYSHFEMSKLYLISKSYSIFQQLNPSQFTFLDLFQIEKSKCLIDYFLKEKYDESLSNKYNIEQLLNRKAIDLQLPIEYYKEIAIFKEKINQLLKFKIIYWEELQKEEPNLKILLDKGAEVLELKTQVVKNYDELIKKSEDIPVQQHMLLYAVFIMAWEKYSYKAQKLVSNYKDFKTLRNAKRYDILSNQSLFGSNSLIIQISGDREKIANIQNITNQSVQIFGYEKVELVNQNVAVIMPSIIGQHHNQYMLKNTSLGKENVIGKQQAIFAMFEQKYIFLVDLYVKILPDLSAGLSYIALIRKLKKNCMFLMVDSKGDIDSCCQEFCQLTGISYKIFQLSKTNIGEMCKDLQLIIQQISNQRKDKVDSNYSRNLSDQDELKKKVDLILKGESIIISIQIDQKWVVADISKDESQGSSNPRLSIISKMNELQKQSIDFTFKCSIKTYRFGEHQNEVNLISLNKIADLNAVDNETEKLSDDQNQIQQQLKVKRKKSNATPVPSNESYQNFSQIDEYDEEIILKDGQITDYMLQIQKELKPQKKVVFKQSQFGQFDKFESAKFQETDQKESMPTQQLYTDRISTQNQALIKQKKIFETQEKQIQQKFYAESKFQQDYKSIQDFNNVDQGDQEIHKSNEGSMAIELQKIEKTIEEALNNKLEDTENQSVSRASQQRMPMDIYTNSSIKCKLIDKQSNAVWLLSFTMIFTIILFSSLMLAFSLQGVSLFEEYSKISNKNNFRITQVLYITTQLCYSKYFSQQSNYLYLQENIKQMVNITDYIYSSSQDIDSFLSIKQESNKLSTNYYLYTKVEGITYSLFEVIKLMHNFVSSLYLSTENNNQVKFQNEINENFKSSTYSFLQTISTNELYQSLNDLQIFIENEINQYGNSQNSSQTLFIVIFFLIQVGLLAPFIIILIRLNRVRIQVLSLGLSISYDDCLNRIVYLEKLAEIINPNDNDQNVDYLTEIQFGRQSEDYNKKSTNYGGKSKKRKSMFKTGQTQELNRSLTFQQLYKQSNKVYFALIFWLRESQNSQIQSGFQISQEVNLLNKFEFLINSGIAFLETGQQNQKINNQSIIEAVENYLSNCSYQLNLIEKQSKALGSDIQQLLDQNSCQFVNCSNTILLSFNQGLLSSLDLSYRIHQDTFNSIILNTFVDPNIQTLTLFYEENKNNVVNQTNQLIINAWFNNFNINSIQQIVITTVFYTVFLLFAFFVYQMVLYPIYKENNHIIQLLFFIPYELIEKNKIIISFLHSYIKIT